MVKLLNTLCQFWRRKPLDFGKYEIVTPGNVSAERCIPSHIATPSYYRTGEILAAPDKIEIKSTEQIEHMRKSCQLASNILKEVEKVIKVGVTTDDIDAFVHEECIKNGAFPSTLRYKGFPKSVCTSVNNVACHGIPDDRALADGDIINVDITVYLSEYHGDCSYTYTVGNVDEQGKELIAVTKECLQKGISVCGPGALFSEIGYAIQTHAEKFKYSVIPYFMGHGIGQYFHGQPEICHTRNPDLTNMLPGMTFTIEPALTPGSIEVEIDQNGWTITTADDARSAQVEHTILITENGHEVLTK